MLVRLYGYRFLRDTVSQETPCYSGPYNIYPFSFFSCIQVHGIKSIVKSFFLHCVGVRVLQWSTLGVYFLAYGLSLNMEFLKSATKVRFLVSLRELGM